MGQASWAKGPHPQVVLFLLSLDPVEGLLLGVDAEREAAGPGGEDAILNRELIGGKALGTPPARDDHREMDVPPPSGKPKAGGHGVSILE